MLHTVKILNRKIRWIFLLSVGFAVLAFTGPIAAFGAGPAPVDLGSAGDFVILAETGITNTGSHTSVITGDIGNSPGTAAQMNNVWCSEITGTIFGVDAAYTGSGTTTCFAGNPPLANKTLVDNAVGDMLTAYNNAAGVVAPAPIVGLGAGNISGMTLAPGLYKWSTDVNINTNVTLSGGASDVWIFQISGNLNVASGGSVPAGIKVVLSGGARPSNIFWQVGGVTGATIGTYATFNGTILSAKQIILQTGSVLNGRALAQTQVTLDATVVSELDTTEICPPIALTRLSTSTGIENVPYPLTPISASGGTAPYTFSVPPGTLPSGLLLSSDGIISGTPDTVGTFDFTVTATDSSLMNCTGLRAYTININDSECQPITLPVVLLPSTGIKDELYTSTTPISASGGTAPYTFSVPPGTLPSGLSLSSGGIISGMPDTVGTFDFTVTATDANGCTGLREYTIDILIYDPDCPLITLSTAPPLPQGTVGNYYNRTISASGGTAPYAFSVPPGTLPSGLSLSSGGIISGTPAAAGTFNFTVTATDDNGCKGFRDYSITINPATTPIPTLSEWGMIIFMTIMAITSIYYMRKKEVDF